MSKHKCTPLCGTYVPEPRNEPMSAQIVTPKNTMVLAVRIAELEKAAEVEHLRTGKAIQDLQSALNYSIVARQELEVKLDAENQTAWNACDEAETHANRLHAKLNAVKREVELNPSGASKELQDILFAQEQLDG